ncbi:MAG: hypothetical protein V2I43_02655 [Parvularcula sp.]|jgi:hypothetical protein|nr:hypothetical protein [Parvularcula sp.]
MAIFKAFPPRSALAALFGVVLTLMAPASAHRMPEVYVTLEGADLGGEPITAITLRLHAEDALRLLESEGLTGVELAEPSVLEALGRASGQGISLSGEGRVLFVGGEVEDNRVYLYLAAEEGSEITDAKVLSEVYTNWTNRVTDLRAEEPVTKVFTQGGPIEGHHH